MCDGQVVDELQRGQNAGFVPRIDINHCQILYGGLARMRMPLMKDIHHALPIRK